MLTETPKAHTNSFPTVSRPMSGDGLLMGVGVLRLLA